MMGQREVAMPRRVSMLPRGDKAPLELRGGGGLRYLALGAVDRGAVPNESAVITSKY